MQSRLESFIEASINTAIGYFIALASQLVIFALLGIEASFSENLVISIWFTVISVARGYLVRRYFNARLHRAAHRWAEKMEERT